MRREPETGLYHFRARVYSPTLGRFLQEDAQGVIATARIALGYQGGSPSVTPPVTGPADEYPNVLNLYAYAQGNPLRFTDPLGLMSYAELTGSTAEASWIGSSLMPALGGAVAWMQGVIGALYANAFMTSMSIMAGGYCMMDRAASSALCDEVARFYDNIGDQPEHVRDGFEEAARTGDQNLDPNEWEQLLQKLKHAGEYFGNKNWQDLTPDQIEEWGRIVDYVDRCNNTFRWSSGGQETIARVAQYGGDKWVCVQRYLNGDFCTAFVAKGNTLADMLARLKQGGL